MRSEWIGLQMVLSRSRFEWNVWWRRKDQLRWLHCHDEAFKRIGGVWATVRVENEKTAVGHGAGAWSTINTT